MNAQQDIDGKELARQQRAERERQRNEMIFRIGPVRSEFLLDQLLGEKDAVAVDYAI